MQTPATPRLALITGASRGLGRSMALHLADAGLDVVGTYRANADEAASLVREVEARGRRAAVLPLDVGRSDTFAAFAGALARTLRDDFGRETFDALVNNAGIGTHAAFADTTEAQFDELLAVHLKGPYFLTQRLLPLLADGGRVLNVSTGLARFTYPGYAAYASAKGGVEVLTRYMARELGARGIRVNVVAPGAIATDFGGGMVRDDADVNRHVASTIPLGRVGEADDVGAAVAALLSDGMGWINGARIEVSGGQQV
ncbi:SDR family oxidoreductase [Roseisolibacter sp. H3M3-2]|uniref:SDR family NAD(P)-dependent oxidoreductase n=1 Tax=Roseisolibacter sp. H3M3-2 TaxID=3031323 RepID=UPI0023DAFD72|nr:SDR family oxidoreductase [Roseisolibacter sp. H3M3-2]MDF1504640.1 SDR family oxidoreductase [Roseisolibacter sp. H3M3-2]